MAVVGPGELDLEVFKRLVAEAAESDLPDARKACAKRSRSGAAPAG